MNKPVCVDVSVTGFQREKTKVVENQKNGKYLDRCVARDLAFLPCVMDSMGSLGDSAIHVCQKLGRKWASLFQVDEKIGQWEIQKQLVFTLIKAQAAHMLCRVVHD